MDPIRLLVELAEEVRVCTRCPLAATRTLAVPGAGNPEASVMLVGEGPGEQEDLAGLPFVGRSGQLLTSELEKIGLGRDAVFITNIVKCRPPGNRAPLPEEVEACQDWLMAQIALIEPRLVVLVGGQALQALLSRKLFIMRARSRVYRKDGILYVPILHPSAALRSSVTMGQFLEDLQKLSEYLSRDIEGTEIQDVGLEPVPLPKPPPKPENFTPAPTKVADAEGTLSLF